jgi:hypothetical protein
LLGSRTRLSGIFCRSIQFWNELNKEELDIVFFAIILASEKPSMDGSSVADWKKTDGLEAIRTPDLRRAKIQYTRIPFDRVCPRLSFRQ